MNTIGAVRMTRTKLAGAAVALMGPALLLTGCGGSGADGTYVSTDFDDLTTLVVDDNTVTYTEMRCEGDPDEAEKSVGELNDDKTSVTWTYTGRFRGADEITVTDSAIDIAGVDTFTREDSDAGKKVHDDWKASCSA